MTDLDAVLQKVAASPELLERLQQGLAGASDRKGRLIELLRTEGLPVDSGEVERALAQTRELGDQELEGVAGGFNPQPDPPGGILATNTQGILIGLLLPAVHKAH
jgi:hypothetical protein